MASQHVFDLLKVRASWGRVGNDRIPSIPTPLRCAESGLPISVAEWPRRVVPLRRSKDPNVKWETTEEADLGIEFTALNGQLTGEVNYYDKKARDLLINVKVPSVAGDADGVVLTNAASIHNQGLEFTLNWRGKITNDLSYRIGGNATLNQEQGYRTERRSTHSRRRHRR